MASKKDSHKSLEQTWVKRFKQASDHQRDNAGNWIKNRKILYGKLGKDKSPYEIAIGWGLCQFLISQIYYTNPTVLVRARDQKARDIAKLLTEICQYDIDEMDLKEAGNLAITDCFVYGYGAVIEDYRNELVEYEEKGEKGREIADQYFCLRRIPPPDLLLDPSGIKLDLSDHRYIFVAYYPTISELKNDKDRYRWLPDDIAESKPARPAKVPIAPGTPESMESKSKEEDPDYKQIRVYEIWDKVSGKIYDFAADKKKLIGARDEWPFQIKRAGKQMFPVTVMGLLAQGETWYPIPVLDLISPQLTNITTINKMFVTDATTKWRKYVTVEGLVDLAQASKILDSTKEGVGIIEVQKDNLDELASGGPHPFPNLRDLVVPIQDISVTDKDYIVCFQVIMEQIQQILGFADTARGGMPKTRSAREAVAIRDAQNRRITKLADAVLTFHRAAVEKHIQLLQQVSDGTRYVKVVDRYNRFQEFKEYTKDDIQGVFYFEALVGSSMPKDTESAKQQYTQFLQMFLPIILQAGYSPVPLIYEAAEMFQIKNIDDFFRNQKQAAMMVAKQLYAAKEGMKVDPKQFTETISLLVSAVLTPEEQASAGAEIRGGGGGQQEVSSPKGQRGESDKSKGGNG